MGATCACGQWPVEEYGPRCPSCVIDERPARELHLERVVAYYFARRSGHAYRVFARNAIRDLRDERGDKR